MQRFRSLSFPLLVIFISACSRAPEVTAEATNAPVQPTEIATETPEPTPAPITVDIWLTTGDQTSLLEQQPAIEFGEIGEVDRTIYVNENHEYQEMVGYGAAVTDSSAWLMGMQMDEEERHELLMKLFSPAEGIGISAIRLPMGASDFTHGPHYSYDDLPPGETDPDLEQFSIDHDREYIIPVLKQILEINPDLKIIASPWSVPGWMKTTDSLIKGQLLPEFYDAYANYFVKFVQAYEAEGIPIYAVTPQNEPRFEPNNYPGMRFEPEDAALVVREHLAPAFEEAGLDTRIIVWDHNWDQWEYPMEFLEDTEAAEAIDGVAWHCYGGNVLSQTLVHDAHPEQDYYFTECTGGAHVPSFEAGLRDDMKNLIVGSVRGWAKTVIKWNIVLDTEYNPNNGGCETCDGLIALDPEDGSIAEYKFDYYSIGHASKFVRSGAYRIASSTWPYNNLESVAFKNSDGSKVLIVANTSATKDITFAVRWGSRAFDYTLSGESVVTFTWMGEQDQPSAPTPPRDAIAKATNGKLVLSWEFSPHAESYTIKRATEAGGPYTVIAEGITIPEYHDTDVSDDETYYYVITAVNLQGESAESDEVTGSLNQPE